MLCLIISWNWVGVEMILVISFLNLIDGSDIISSSWKIETSPFLVSVFLKEKIAF